MVSYVTHDASQLMVAPVGIKPYLKQLLQEHFNP